MQQRNESLDALRGLAIIGMILSGSIAYGGILPAWMYHAQVPPPLYKFISTKAGITWVDLVFPFFLFSMGAALPLSLKKQIDANSSWFSIVTIAVRRFILLIFFALFSQHFKAWELAATASLKEYLLSIVGFVLLFFQLYHYKGEKYLRLFKIAKILACAVAVLLLWWLPFKNDAGFSLYNIDIILLILANMALTGTIIYYATRHKPLLRLSILPFIMAIFLAGKSPGSGWQGMLLTIEKIGVIKIDWLHLIEYLPYLFIVIPGTFAGEWLLKYAATPMLQKSSKWIVAVLLCLLVIVTNIYCLYLRLLVLNLALTVVSITGILLLFRKLFAGNILLKNMLQAASYLLLLGIAFEAFEGGIKKDYPTYSYYFVSGGLAFFMLVILTILPSFSIPKKIIFYIGLIGKNPMVAYVAGELLLSPLLQISHLQVWFNKMDANPITGFFKGVLFTTMVGIVTIFFTRRKWFWKT